MILHLSQMLDLSCGLCGKLFLQEDVVPLNGTAEQIQDLRKQLDRRRAKKAPKESSKAKKRKLDSAEK